MAAEQDALRQQIAEKREEIGEDLTRLQSSLRMKYESTTDWHQIVRGHPMTAFGIMMGLGLLLGLVLARATD